MDRFFLHTALFELESGQILWVNVVLVLFLTSLFNPSLCLL